MEVKTLINIIKQIGGLMLLKTTSRHSGEKFYLRKFCLIIISLALVSIHINAQNWWTQKSQIPTPRAAAPACVIDNKIYVIGGYSPSFGNFAVNEVYDPSTDTWQTKSPLPQARGYLSCAVVNGIIYAIGGGYPTATKRVDAYDPLTDSWVQKQNMPTARFGMQACTYGNKIYLIGGGQSQNTALGTVEVYDPVNDTWEQGDNMPIISVFLTGAIVNDKIYVIGGTSNWTTGVLNVWEYSPPVIPVELTSFTATANGKEVTLYWTTATELNNHGFEIQRKALYGDFVTIAFVKGQGTTTQQNKYSFADKNLDEGKYSYRLKQMDYGGEFSYSSTVEVDVRMLDKFALDQNYPNPFNPSTTIGYVLQKRSNTKLTLLNALGEEIAILLNEEQDKGYHKVEFDGSKLTSGVYFYKLQGGNFVETKKMILLR